MEYEFWLAGIQGVAAHKKIRLRECMKTAEAIYYIEETQLHHFEFLNENDRNKIMQAQKNSCFRTDYEKMNEKGIQFVPFFSKVYPENLKEITDPPYALYVKGNLPERKAKKAAIIGARRCTPYGEKYAIDFARVLAAHGVEVISGMARGIDGMGHRGALLSGGKTYAVLGSGADVCYPREHIGLYVDILEQGGDTFGTAAGSGSACPQFSCTQPHHQRTVRCNPGHGGREKKRITYNSRSGAGTGPRCLRPARAGKQCFK